MSDQTYDFPVRDQAHLHLPRVVGHVPTVLGYVVFGDWEGRGRKINVWYGWGEVTSILCYVYQVLKFIFILRTKQIICGHFYVSKELITFTVISKTLPTTVRRSSKEARCRAAIIVQYSSRGSGAGAAGASLP